MTVQEDINTIKQAQKDLEIFRGQLKRNNRQFLAIACFVCLLLGLCVGFYLGYSYEKVTIEGVVLPAEKGSSNAGEVRPIKA